MSLSLDLSAALNPLVGQTFVPPKTVAVSDGSGISLSVDVIAVESLGVSCEELRLQVQRWYATLDTLKKWADDLVMGEIFSKTWDHWNTTREPGVVNR